MSFRQADTPFSTAAAYSIEVDAAAQAATADL
jgi:hypothetical protein